MKKRVTIFVLVIFLSTGFVYGQGAITNLWENSAAGGTLPTWFSTTGSTERGFAYGVVGGKERLYVVSRNAGLFIKIIDAATGAPAEIDTLRKTGISGGTFALNDIEVSDDGIIFGCNLTINSTTSALKVYRWDSETSAAVVVFNGTTTSAYRYGDKMTLVGSTADNSIIIYFAASQASGGPDPLHVLKLTTTDNGMTFTAAEIPIAEKSGSSPAVGPVGLGVTSLYVNSNGNNAKQFDVATSAKLGEISGSILGIGSNAIRYIETANRKYVVSFQYSSPKENARVVEVTTGDADAASFVETPPLGTNANGNGTGDIALKNLGDGKFVVYVLSTNNGFGAYEINANYLKGVYYVGATGTGPGGADPDYPSLKAAIDELNTKMVLGNCTFYITSNIDEPCTGGIGLGLAVDPSPYFITFKPYMGVAPVITLAYPSDGNDGPSGAFVIGIPDLGTAGRRINWNDIKTTRNIIIDGSNTEGGMTRDLTIQNATTAHRNGIPIVIVGDAQNITVKNTNLYYQPVAVSTAGGLFIGSVMIRARYDFIPKNILVENNHLNANFDGVAQNAQGIGLYCASSTLPTGDYPNAITIKNNLIEGKRRGVGLNVAGSLDILNNEIILNQTIADGLTNEAIFAYNVKADAIINIQNNMIKKVSSMNSTDTTTGNAGISIETAGTYNIFNNMISGFELTAANPSAYVYGVKNSSSSATMNLYHNTLVMNDLADIGTGSVNYYGFHIADGVNNVKNNIIVNNEDNFASYNFYRTGTAGTIVSDYNDLYRSGTVNAKTGLWNGVDAASLADWQTVSGLDANSKAKAVEFVSASDLHLTGASVGDLDLAGTPLTEVPTDIDGQSRSMLNPYIGADEGDVELKPIVVLTIAEARIDADGDFYPDRKGDTVVVRGVVGSPNYGSRCQYYFQDETAGLVLYSSSISIALNIGDEIQARGVIDFYRGVTEIVPFAASDVQVLSSGNAIQPKKIKVAEIGEEYEAQVVQVDSIRFIDIKQWPAAGSNGNVYFTDGKDTNYIFIDKETDLDGWTPPEGLLTMIAEVDQYTSSSSVYDDGYSLRGRIKEDFIVIPVPVVAEPLYTLWAKTQAAGTFPKYFSTDNYTRGMAYGNVGGQDRVYVVTRFGPHRIVIHDAIMGDSLGVIPKPPQSEGVGLFHLNCVDVSDDGIIFACNMSLGSDATNPFRVYRWDNETAAATTAISYDAALGRMGDMFSVYGKASDNSLKIYAAVTNSNKFVRFTTTDNGMTFTPDVITVSDGSWGSVPNIAEVSDGTLYLKAYGRPLIHYQSDGTMIDTVSTTVVGTSVSKIKYFETGGKKYIIAYYPDVPGAGGAEKINVLDVSLGAKLANVVFFSSSIGSFKNGNGVGSVDVKIVDDESFLFYILGTNNGVAGFSNKEEFVLANIDTLFYGNTPTLLENPYGKGFIAGTNSYGDIGKYQRFDFKVNDMLYGFRFYFGYKEIVDTPDTLYLVVKTVGANGAPDVTLATVKTTTATMDTTLIGSTFFLPSPLKVDGPVFVGFEWNLTADDTFAVYCDQNGEGENANRAWEKFNDNQYNDFGTTLNPDFSWNIDVDLWIAAYYKKAIVSGVNELANQLLPRTFAVSQNYPNPFNPVTRFSVTIPKTTEVKIIVYNALGQEVTRLFQGNLPDGVYHFEFDGSRFASGVYFYHVKTKEHSAVKRMVILK